MIRSGRSMRATITKAYLTVALAWGAAMVFLSPPFQAPDEPNHFYRALTISEGRWMAIRQGNFAGAPLPVRTAEWVEALVGDIPFHPERKQILRVLLSRVDREGGDAGAMFAHFPNTSLYSPLLYLPQAMGLWVGRMLQLPLLYAYYLGRLLNLVATVALCGWACHRMPYGQATLVMIALSPMFVFQTASMSADALTYGLAVAFCAAILKASTDTRVGLRRREIFGLVFLGALVGLSKPSSAPLPLFALVLMIRPPVASTGRPWRTTAAIIGISWMTMLAWSLIARGLYVDANPSIRVEPDAQLALVLGHPARFLAVLWHTLAVRGEFMYLTAVGVLGWLDTPLDAAYINGFYCTLLVSGLVAEPARVPPGWRGRALAGVVVVASYALIVLIMYLTWTAVGASVVDNVQGRFFLPLAVLWVVLLQWPAVIQERLGPTGRLVLTGACVGYAVLLLGHACVVMVRRYWA